MKVYIVIEMKDNYPYRIVGVFKNEKDANIAAYGGGHGWCNVVEKELL